MPTAYLPAAGSRTPAFEAAETLEQLLWATKTLVLPTGQTVEVPDNEVRFNAALAIYGRFKFDCTPTAAPV